MTDGLVRVVELHATGLAAHARGRPRQALRTLRRADALGLTLPSSPDLTRARAAIAISVAATVAEIDGLDRGGAALLVARDLAEQIDDPALLVKVHSQAAFIAARSGRFDAALEELGAAEQLIAHAEPHEQFAILLNGGNLHMLQGDLAAARRRFDRAVERAQAQDRPVELFKALHNLGYAEFLAGRLPQAIAAMDAAGELTVDVSRSIWLLDRARVLGEAGLISAADASLADAARISRADRSAQDLGEIELERARCALITGEVQAARRLAMSARDRFRRRGNDRWRRNAELLLLQGDLAAGRPGRRLAGPAHRLRAEFARDGARVPERTAALIAVEAHLAAGEVADAAATLAGLGRSRSGDPITTRLHTDYARARFELATGHRAAARRHAQHGLADLANYQARFGSIDLATAAAVHGRRLADLDLGLALASGRAEQVLESAERARAVSTRLPPVRPPEDPQTAALLADLRQTVEALRDGRDRRAVERLSATRRDLEARIAARGWTRPGGGVVREVAAVEAARAELADATLASFSRVGRELHAVVVSAAGLRLVHLGDAAEIDELVRRVRADLDVVALPTLPAALRDTVQASLARSLARLDRTLLVPLRVSGRLVVVSTGVLGQLPWGLLPGLRGVPVVVTPSVTAWLTAATAPAARTKRVVAIAGPGVGRGSDEADAVARAWTTRRPHRLIGEQATAAAVTDALAGARLAHVAAHGVHQTENPLFSSVRLADGPLFAHELDQSARTPDHVVLSACELGLATVRPGDEALGLTSVLLHLGTRSVVAGVARVGDELAATTMAGYHDRLRSGQDSALALAETLAESPRPQPFVCFGAAVVA